MKTSRFLYLSSAACMAAMLIVSIADAQPPGGGRGRGRGGFGGFGGPPSGGRGFQLSVSKADLLRSEDVMDELKIGEGQSETIKAALESYREERESSRPDRSAFENLSDDERRAMFEKMMKDRETLQNKTDEILVALLEKEQVERLNQIQFQLKLRSGLVGALKDEELRGKLSLTDEQLAKLDEAEKAAQEAQEKMREEMRAAFGRGRDGGDGERPDFNAMREKMEAARKQTETQVMAVLNDDQKSKLEGMKGKPFELDMRQLFQRGGGFGGPPPGGGFGRPGGGRGGDDQGGGGRRRRPAQESDDSV